MKHHMNFIKSVYNMAFEVDIFKSLKSVLSVQDLIETDS